MTKPKWNDKTEFLKTKRKKASLKDLRGESLTRVSEKQQRP